MAINIQINTDFGKTITYEELVQMPPGTVAQWEDRVGAKYVHFVVIANQKSLCVYPRDSTERGSLEQSVCLFAGTATCGLFKLTGQNVTITIG